MIDKDQVLRDWDLSMVPSPSYVLHQTLLNDNLRVIDKVRKATGVEIIVALKANATWAVFPTLRQHSDGATASSLAEARLVFEEMGVKAHTYAPVYMEEEIDQLLSYSSHLTFNSLSQYKRYGKRAQAKGLSCGLRVNPEYNTVEVDLYNPCSATSRLGVPASELDEWPEGIEGLHFHALCESRPADLQHTIEAVEQKFGKFFPLLKWINMGGGHLMTHKEYDENLLIDILNKFQARHPHLRIILEPGSAFTWDTGVLVARVEDIVRHGGRNTLMLNVSFACHMPDCLEMPYKPVILGMADPDEDDCREEWFMGGNSCLAGDSYGSWVFVDGHQPMIGDSIVFRDMIHYTMVKTTMFNGVTHPSLLIYSPESGFDMVRKFDYEDYKQRMG